jgi:hypothetical protein
MSIASLSNKKDLNLNVGQVNCTALLINGSAPSGTGNFSTPSAQNLDMGNNNISNVGVIALKSDSTAFSNSLKSPTGMVATVNYTLPATDGASGDVLSTNGSGVLDWIGQGGGGGGVANPMTADLDAGGFNITDVAQVTANNVEINDQLKLVSGTTGFKSVFEAFPTMTDSVTYVLPATAGTSGYVLSTNGTGTLNWIEQSGGGGGVNNPMTADLGGGGFDISDVGTLDLNSELSLKSGTTNFKSIIQSDANMPASVTYTLPATAGTANYVLSTDGDGVLNWVTQSVANPMTADLDAGGFNINNGTDIVLGGSVVLNSATTAFSTFIGAQSNQTEDLVIGLPLTNGNSGDVLSTDGSGLLSWISPTTGGGVANPMTSDLDGGGNNITNVAQVTANNIEINDQLKLVSGTTAFKTVIEAFPTMSASVTYVLPATAGTADYVLSTNGSGTLNWVEQSGGGGSNITSFGITPSSITTIAGADVVDLSTSISTSTMTFPCLLTFTCAGFSFGTITAPTTANGASVPIFYLGSTDSDAKGDVINSSGYSTVVPLASTNVLTGFYNAVGKNIIPNGFSLSAYVSTAPTSGTIFLLATFSQNITFTGGFTIDSGRLVSIPC